MALSFSKGAGPKIQGGYRYRIGLEIPPRPQPLVPAIGAGLSRVSHVARAREVINGVLDPGQRSHSSLALGCNPCPLRGQQTHPCTPPSEGNHIKP